MGHLYFVRHGQTNWNIENKVCGTTDIPLTPEGHKQAIMTGNTILESGIAFDEIVSSPLIRAKETATHISEITGKHVRFDTRLREQNFGKYEGTSRIGGEFLHSKRSFADKYDGGESLLKLAQRVYNLLDELKADQRTYLIVAHNGVARMVESYFHSMSNEEYASFRIANCAVLTYTWDD